MSCKNCKNYSPLVEPRELCGYAVIYGYCFKRKRIGLVNTGYPVYIPDGKCEGCEPIKTDVVEREIPKQMSIFDLPEVMP